jgi:plasmid stabilization system protein ParE
VGKVVWTKKAAGNLRSIHEYIAKDSRFYADRFTKALVRATERLKTLPQSGRIVPELESLAFREVIYRNYRIIYRIQADSNDVQILAVVHGAREGCRTLTPGSSILRIRKNQWQPVPLCGVHGSKDFDSRHISKRYDQ